MGIDMNYTASIANDLMKVYNAGRKAGRTQHSIVGASIGFAGGVLFTIWVLNQYNMKQLENEEVAE